MVDGAHLVIGSVSAGGVDVWDADQECSDVAVYSMSLI